MMINGGGVAQLFEATSSKVLVFSMSTEASERSGETRSISEGEGIETRFAGRRLADR